MGHKISPKTWQATTNKYFPWIHRKAKKMVRPLPYHVAGNLEEELVSSGYRGLVEAMHRLDPERTKTHDAFIKRTVTGAMLDELRAVDPLTRGQRREYREMRNVERSLTAKLQRPPSSDEMAEATNKSLKDVHKTAAKTHWREVSMDAPTAEASGLKNEASSSTSTDSFDVTLYTERRQLVRKALEKLPTPCQNVVQKYYFEGKSLQDIGAGMNVCDARASQLRKEGVQRLQRELVQRLAA